MRVASSGSHWELLMGPMKANSLVVQRALSLEKLLGRMRAGQLDFDWECLWVRWLAASLVGPRGLPMAPHLAELKEC